jgi:uncharacterized membrane protein YfcA
MTIAIAGGAILIISTVFAGLGLGGGILFVPLLHWSGFDLQSTAIPLGLLLNGTNTLLALVPFSRAGLVDWKGGLPMAVAAAATAPLGAVVQPRFDHATILVLFAAAVSLAAARALRSTRLGSGAGAQPSPSQSLPSDTLQRVLFRVGIGAIVGFLGGLLGIGAGFLVAPALMALAYPPKQMAATTALVVTVCSFAGLAGYVPQFEMPLDMAALGVCAVLIGSQLGAHIMLRGMQPAWINRGYAAVLSAVALTMLSEVLFRR